MPYKIPPIGQTIYFVNTQQKDWLTQKLVGEEQGVLWWAVADREFESGDLWSETDPQASLEV